MASDLHAQNFACCQQQVFDRDQEFKQGLVFCCLATEPFKTGSRVRELEEMQVISTFSGQILMVFLASAVGTVWETNFCLLILLVKKIQLLKSISMEIVMEDENCYCFRKSISHLSGSFTSFWQAYLNTKTGFKWGLFPSYSLN